MLWKVPFDSIINQFDNFISDACEQYAISEERVWNLKHQTFFFPQFKQNKEP